MTDPDAPTTTAPVTVTCPDGSTRTFPDAASADDWVDRGHFCLSRIHHTVRPAAVAS